jgi:hypothetical protein
MMWKSNLTKKILELIELVNVTKKKKIIEYALAILLVAAATNSVNHKLNTLALQFNAALAVQEVEHTMQLKALSIEVVKLSKAVSAVAELTARSRTFAQKVFVEATYFDVALNTLAVIIGVAGAVMIICAVVGKGGPGVPPASSDDYQETLERILSTTDAGQAVLENLISSVENVEGALKSLVPYVDVGTEALDGVMSSGQTGEAVLSRLVQVLLTKQEGEDAMEAVGQLVQDAVLQEVAKSTKSILSSINNVDTIQVSVVNKLELIYTTLLEVSRDESLEQAAAHIAELLARGGGPT